MAGFGFPPYTVKKETTKLDVLHGGLSASHCTQQRKLQNGISRVAAFGSPPHMTKNEITKLDIQNGGVWPPTVETTKTAKLDLLNGGPPCIPMIQNKTLDILDGSLWLTTAHTKKGSANKARHTEQEQYKFG